jgi:hypothetical protein
MDIPAEDFGRCRDFLASLVAFNKNQDAMDKVYQNHAMSTMAGNEDSRKTSTPIPSIISDSNIYNPPSPCVVEESSGSAKEEKVSEFVIWNKTRPIRY